MRAPRAAPLLVLLLAWVVPSGSDAPAAELGPSSRSLVKHAVAMGRKRTPSSYDEKRFVKLLGAVPQEELLPLAEVLRAQPGASDALSGLADRVEARYWDAIYPGTGELTGFAQGVASKETAVRARVLRAAMTLEDLTTARRLAVETAGWKDPDVRLEAAETLSGLLDLDQADEAGVAALVGLLKDGDPAVRCLAARHLERSGRPEALDAYAAGLEDGARRKVSGPDGEETLCFGAQAFYRLAELSGRHDAMEYEDYRAEDRERRAEIALDLTSWWEEAKPAFSFHRTRWERFAAVPVVRAKVIDRDRPDQAFFQFRSPRDASRVRLELKHLEFRAGEEPWSWVVDWRLEFGIGGNRNLFGSAEKAGAPAHRRAGVPREGAAWISVAAQPIGKDRARVVIRFADFEKKR